MTKLLLVPDQAGYATTLPDGEVIQVTLDGGKPFTRANVIGGWHTVDLSFVVDQDGYNVFWAFYRSQTARGALTFTLDMILDSPVYQEYTAVFVAGSVRTTGKNGDIYTISAQIKVEPQEEDTDYDSAIVLLYEATSVDMAGYISLLSTIVNETWPEA